jgi:flagellar basal-body rod protein FlgB
MFVPQKCLRRRENAIKQHFAATYAPQNQHIISRQVLQVQHCFVFVNRPSASAWAWHVRCVQFRAKGAPVFRKASMIIDGVFKKANIELLDKSLDASALRQRVRASNIANVSTVGYERREVSFEKELRTAMHGAAPNLAVTDPRHIGQPGGVEQVRPKAYVPDDESLPSGANNVDIDYEMAELAKNQALFASVAQFLGGRFRSLRSAIRGRTV